jgi:hypothetical protein
MMMGWATLWAIFFPKSSGHPVQDINGFGKENKIHL